MTPPHSEKQSLLIHPSRPRPGFDTLTYSASKGSPTLHSLKPGLHSESPHLFSLALRTKLVLAMVAIPTYLLASSAISSLGSLVNRNPVPAPEPERSSASTSSSSAFGSVLGPLISTSFADPAIIHLDGTSYAFATHSKGVGPDLVHVQVATSTDNHTWTLLEHHDALPHVGAWETGLGVWAPDVVQLVSSISPRSLLSLHSTPLVRLTLFQG
jgi:hypothetical protein